MGALCSLCSKKWALSGGHVLGSASPTIDNSGRRPQQLPQQQQQQQQQHRPRQHNTPQTADARRVQAAAAAEQRQKAQNKRGVNAANPNSGRLAAQLEASRTAPIAPEAPNRREDTLIDDWRN
ncbi:hypothetical protein BGY98DRAFT_942964 [Russula aff. rugulosa BPL654]|nr:hypothetical protein BGY98DRAFT_942964 [Russula aff. rugulosa BPL654]